MIAWLIWTQRNQVRMNKLSCNVDRIAQVVKDQFEEFSSVQPPKQPRVPKPRNLCQPPPLDLFKINFDGVVFSHENKSDVGVVIRNNQGLIIASLSQQFPQAFQVEEIEALVAIRPLELGFDISIACDVLEGDSILIHEGLI